MSNLISSVGESLNRSRMVGFEAIGDNSGLQKSWTVDGETEDDDTEEVFEDSHVDIGRQRVPHVTERITDGAISKGKENVKKCLKLLLQDKIRKLLSLLRLYNIYI